MNSSLRIPHFFASVMVAGAICQLSGPAHGQGASEPPLPGGESALQRLEQLGNASLSTPLPSSSPVSRGTSFDAKVAAEASVTNKTATDQKNKGPTTITANASDFDQRANKAVFISSVVVVDPEFNVKCDKLTAFLKHTDKTKPAAVSNKPLPKSSPNEPETPAPKTGALDRAVAEAEPGNRVEITQDKVDADGKVTKGIGHGTKADYNAVTGDIVLSGMPDAQQNNNLVVATSSSTILIFNRNGKLKAVGPHTTTIVDKGEAGL